MKNNCIVLDTNTLISAMIFPKSVPGLALEKAINSYKIVVSDESIDELTSIVLKKKFDKYIPFSLRQIFLQDFEEVVEWKKITVSIKKCRDPKDDKFLSLAISAKARIIVSGDDDLLVLNPFQNISIINCTDFLHNY